jgi:hypothetical protein
MDKTPDVEAVTKMAEQLSQEDLQVLLKKLAPRAQVRVTTFAPIKRRLRLNFVSPHDVARVLHEARETLKLYTAERREFQAIMDATPEEEQGEDLRKLMSIIDPAAWLKHRREYYPTREELWALPPEERNRRATLALSRTHDQDVEIFDAFGVGDEDMDEVE